MKKIRIRVWDLPIRLFHWLLVILMVGAFISGQLGGDLIEWHGRAGLAIFGLVVFRLVWGFVGSTHARFANFIPRPSAIGAYVRGTWRGQGHNPLGALSVLGLLGLLGLQAVTGLFATDDIAFRGPLAMVVSDGTSQWLSSLHRLNVTFLIALVVLHLAAILFYTLVKKENLILPMISGAKEEEEEGALPVEGGGLLPFLFALILTLAAVVLATGSFIEPPPPAPTPAW